MKHQLVVNKSLQKMVPGVWLTAAAVSICLLTVFILVGMISARGLSYFLPSPVQTIVLQQPIAGQSQYVGQILAQEDSYQALNDRESAAQRILLRHTTSNLARSKYLWIELNEIKSMRLDKDIMVVERLNASPLFVYAYQTSQAKLLAKLEQINQLQDRVAELRRGKLSRLLDQVDQAGPDLPSIRDSLADVEAEISALQQKMQQKNLLVTNIYGQQVEIKAQELATLYWPNQMNFWQKSKFFVQRFIDFVSDYPREANTRGGVFPAIFGTVLMVLLMSLLVAPMGVIAAIYLHEYAGNNWLTRIIRIAVINLAGVPSIVYGVFGLGFFVYFVGTGIDEIFFSEQLPSPTFGSPGILWSALTLAILTLPIVIVTTEEGLSRIPVSIREGSYALGANRSETIWRVILPMASPAIMTGLILAVARAAGEVAPLMLVGVVKMAPTLPLDNVFPYLHLDRQFMHLGFHIYDLGFQSSQIEAVRPMVFATAFLLILIVVFLNLAAVSLRNRLNYKYHYTKR
ncbi:phosphate ABC transporter permease PstA [Gayadomonas joobiniege]|uniref:phosphate ABC transporter permease PstA n=1 Tax=Gayadomonas joobiniege TaxID=1234606 RepID=UPI000376AD68|nr:phosphate ABC transporter permease PstA [Gayadomonas joobiniege]